MGPPVDLSASSDAGFFSDEDFDIVEQCPEFKARHVPAFNTNSMVKSVQDMSQKSNVTDARWYHPCYNDAVPTTRTWANYRCVVDHELKYHPINCLAKQQQVTDTMRSTLLHWVESLVISCGYSLETFCLATNLIDRFLITTSISRDCLQLLGGTAFFVAAKQVEQTFPPIGELVRLCDCLYSNRQVACMEILLLQRLRFGLHISSPSFFLDTYANMWESTVKDSSTMCSYIREWHANAERILGCGIQDYTVSQNAPSVLAMASLFLACSRQPFQHKLSLMETSVLRSTLSQVNTIASSWSNSMTQENTARACDSMNRLFTKRQTSGNSENGGLSE